MAQEARKTAIDIVGDVPWGAHFCQFYETKEDLIDILVPYFKAGLENNEFCMWVTSEPLNVEDAKRSLKKEVKNLDHYIKAGRIEILDFSQWYTKPGYFDSDKVLQGWIEKERQALKKGFDGLRLTGNTFWLEKGDWESFKNYEAAINSVIGKYRMLAICTYSLDKCTALEIIDVVSNHQCALIKQKGKWQIIESAEHEKTAEALRGSEEKYRAIFEQAADSIVLVDRSSGALVEFNNRACENLGYTREEFQKLKIPDFELVESAEEVLRHIKKNIKHGIDTFETKHRTKDGRIRDVLVSSRAISIAGKDFVQGIWHDITEHKNVEARRRLAGRILRSLNREIEGLEVIHDVLAFIKDSTGFEAVGIRLHEGDDFPYFETKGFSQDFVKSENYLCVRDKNGKQTYDSQGNPVLECMCGNVLSGRTDPDLPFFTEGGSFWTNSTTELLANTSTKDRQRRTRNRCNKEGYESVALIPLRSGYVIVGLLQLNDTRTGCFSTKMIHFFEEIGASIGIALARIQAEGKMENLAKFPSENPNPVLRISADGTLLYANHTADSMIQEWSCRTGQTVPDMWRKTTVEVLANKRQKRIEYQHDNKIFAFLVVPVAEAGYANLYGRDITDRKAAEEDLRKHRQHLKELVETRTAELTETNKQLLTEIERRKRLESEILNISENERRRIGEELHDSLGQQLTGISFMTKALEQKLAVTAPNEVTNVTEIANLVNQATDQARGLAKGLHPVDLGADGLMLSLEELAATTKNLFGITCTFKCDKAVEVDDTTVAVYLYRIAQEAVNNAVKHGKATKIEIVLLRGKDTSVMTIKNDGLDFPKEFEARGTGIGLQIMDHRVDLIGGSLDIHAAEEGGTIVTCTFPNKNN